MAGLDPAIQSQFELPCVFLDGRLKGLKGGHDDGSGGNIPVIKFRDDGGGVRFASSKLC